MTNKEAANFLSQVKFILLNSNSWLESTKTPIKESFDMAISALHAQTDGDCIGRQAAIDAFMTSTSDGDKAEWCKWVLEQLPSTQPEPHYCKECKWSRCRINVDKYGNTETYWHCFNWGVGTDEEGYCYEWERKIDE